VRVGLNCAVAFVCYRGGSGPSHFVTATCVLCNLHGRMTFPYGSTPRTFLEAVTFIRRRFGKQLPTRTRSRRVREVVDETLRLIVLHLTREQTVARYDRRALRYLKGFTKEIDRSRGGRAINTFFGIERKIAPITLCPLRLLGNIHAYRLDC